MLLGAILRLGRLNGISVHSLHHIQQNACAFGQRTAPGILPLVGQRRQKLRDQVAMCGVNFHPGKARTFGGPCGVGKAGDIAGRSQECEIKGIDMLPAGDLYAHLSRQPRQRFGTRIGHHLHHQLCRTAVQSAGVHQHEAALFAQ